MAKSSTLWRLIPLVAGTFAGVGVFVIVMTPGDFDELARMAVAGGAAAERLSPSLDGPDASRTALPVELERVGSGFRGVTDLQPVPGDARRLVVLQKTGQASLLDLATGEHSAWFQVDVHTRSEMGLLGIAFAADFDTSGVFYTHHSPPSGDKGIISRWTVDPTTLRDPERTAEVLSVDQPYRNHDGGQLQIGPDGHLYVALGDGGAGFDPQGHGQNGQTLLGSILRIDPKADGGYDIPADNPFVDDPSVHDAIFAYGLRNPWRFAFTPDGRIVTGDVGQNAWEEIDLVPVGGNLGWAHVEGRACLKEPCTGFVDPIWVYDHETHGNSVTGGVVAQGSGVPGLDGHYVFGDFGSGRLWALTLPDEPVQPADDPRALGRFDVRPSTFGVDGRGRVYVGDYSGGGIYRIVPGKAARD